MKKCKKIVKVFIKNLQKIKKQIKITININIIIL